MAHQAESQIEILRQEVNLKNGLLQAQAQELNAKTQQIISLEVTKRTQEATLDVYRRVTKHLLYRGNIEDFAQLFLTPFLPTGSLKRSSQADIERAYHGFLHPHIRHRSANDRRVARRTRDLIRTNNQTPDAFISHISSVYQKASSFVHSFRNFCDQYLNTMEMTAMLTSPNADYTADEVVATRIIQGIIS